MSVELLNFIETVINGLMSGIMYSLVALGFVLIFKASGVFNFAQGVFALFAALTLVGFQTGQVPFSHLINELFGTNFHNWYPSLHSFFAIILTIITMIVLAWLIEKLVLKQLVNQEPIILFMATIGLALKALPVFVYCENKANAVTSITAIIVAHTFNTSIYIP